MGALVFVYDPNETSRNYAADVLTKLGTEVTAVSSAAEATALLEEATPDLLLLAGNRAGIEICQYVQGFTGIRAPIVALLDANQSIEPTLKEMDADGYLRQPATAAALETTLSLAERLRALRRQRDESEHALLELRGKLELQKSTTDPSQLFHHFDSIKDLLALEVRRAKRYGYPLSLMMIGIDAVEQLGEKEAGELKRKVTAGLAIAVAKAVRVIDLPIHYADDRIMVFLPHTDLEGAAEVGRRIRRRIKRITYRRGEETTNMTASVGLTGIGSGDKVTFSRLIRNATAALRAAQLKGGDRLVERAPTDDEDE
ncbi:MAG: diguanylate cyclase [Gammaproteobacteria bacterium]|nr:diguanylate cyclase [Gammaproteobacteria bacterium]